MAARADVTEFTTTVTAIVQAEKLGGDIAGILDQLANEARDHRMMRAEEVAAQLPVVMTFPMALCMLPALFVMIFGAVAAQISANEPARPARRDPVRLRRDRRPRRRAAICARIAGFDDGPRPGAPPSSRWSPVPP